MAKWRVKFWFRPDLVEKRCAKTRPCWKTLYRACIICILLWNIHKTECWTTEDVLRPVGDTSKIMRFKQNFLSNEDPNKSNMQNLIHLIVRSTYCLLFQETNLPLCLDYVTLQSTLYFLYAHWLAAAWQSNQKAHQSCKCVSRKKEEIYKMHFLTLKKHSLLPKFFSLSNNDISQWDPFDVIKISKIETSSNISFYSKFFPILRFSLRAWVTTTGWK